MLYNERLYIKYMTPKSNWIVIDKYTIKTYLSIFDLVNRHWIVHISFCCIFILLLHKINTNKYFLWAGKPLFSLPTSVSKSLVLFASYDLNSDSVYSPRCSRKRKWTTTRRFSAKKRFRWVDCLGRFETNCLLLTRFMIHNDPQLIPGWTHGKKVLRNTWKNFVFPSSLHLNVCYLSKILNLT